MTDLRASPQTTYSCPCGLGEFPCPGPDGKPLCCGVLTPAAQPPSEPYAVEYRVEHDGHLYSHMHVGKPPEGAQDVHWLYLGPQSPAATAWQPIETAPKDGTVVFIAGQSSNGTWFAADARWDGAYWCLFHPDRDVHDEPSFGPISCWMPIPPFPSTEGDRHG